MCMRHASVSASCDDLSNDDDESAKKNSRLTAVRGLLMPRIKHILPLAEGSPSYIRHWRRATNMMSNASFGIICRSALLLILILIVVAACFVLPVDRILNDFLIWIHVNLGPWGPVALALAYIPLTILAVPGSILTIGGGYLFGLPVGFLADTIGATFGATAAFLVGRTIGRPLVNAKLRDYPQFQSILLAVRRSGFKIVLLLRLVPIVPFNILNYLLSVTPISTKKYMLASWIGMMPITMALVYVGTTIKDLSEISHRWGHFSTFEWVILLGGLVASGLILIIISRIARKSLDRAIIEIEAESSSLPVSALETADALDLHQPLMIHIDSSDTMDRKRTLLPKNDKVP